MFTSSQLSAYLERIGLARPRRPTVDALVRIHRAHIDTFPYENLDIQLGRPIRLDDEALFDKFVRGGRGGYCYEKNHVLALALEAMGFDVRRVLGAVARETEGEENWYNHMPLVVRFSNGEFVADTGLGTGFRDPLPLRTGSHRVGPFNFGMWQLEDELWRCTIDPRLSDLSFDFTVAPRDIGEFAEKCRELSTSPDSPFVKTLTAQLPLDDATMVLRARTLTIIDPALSDGKIMRIIADLDRFSELLVERFGLTLGDEELGLLWAKACEQHERKLAEDAEKSSSASGA
ncbi:arylamine N-acetyltransferase family protein [Glycomyces tarimensis]